MTESPGKTTSSARVLDAVSADRQPSRIVRLARESDLHFLLDLQRKWSNNLGFLPAQSFERYTSAGQILVVEENAEPAGYLSFTVAPNGLLRIPQVAVHPDVLRTTCGTKIMRHIVRFALRNSCAVVRLTSRNDLPANDFWPTLGFRATAIFTPKTTRNRPLIEWTLPLFSADALLTARSRRRTLLPDILLP